MRSGGGGVEPAGSSEGQIGHSGAETNSQIWRVCLISDTRYMKLAGFNSNSFSVFLQTLMFDSD